MDIRIKRGRLGPGKRSAQGAPAPGGDRDRSGIAASVSEWRLERRARAEGVAMNGVPLGALVSQDVTPARPCDRIDTVAGSCQQGPVPRSRGDDPDVNEVFHFVTRCSPLRRGLVCRTAADLDESAKLREAKPRNSRDGVAFGPPRLGRRPARPQKKGRRAWRRPSREETERKTGSGQEVVVKAGSAGTPSRTLLRSPLPRFPPPPPLGTRRSGRVRDILREHSPADCDQALASGPRRHRSEIQDGDAQVLGDADSHARSTDSLSARAPAHDGIDRPACPETQKGGVPRMELPDGGRAPGPGRMKAGGGLQAGGERGFLQQAAVGATMAVVALPGQP